MEITDLNTALIEAYRNLDRTTRAAKEMARSSKTAQKQAERATKLWQPSEQKLAVLEHQCQDHQTLSLAAPNNEAPPAPTQNPSSRVVDTETQTNDTAHPSVATVVKTGEKSTQEDRASCPQTMQASMQMVLQNVITTNETSTQTDRTPRLQTMHVSTQTLQPPVVTTTERSTQTDRAPHSRTDPPPHVATKKSSRAKSLSLRQYRNVTTKPSPNCENKPLDGKLT